MTAGRYAIGVDFGTESGRAVLVDVADGREVATAVYRYRNGVVDEHLPPPDEDVELGPDWALQDPADYVNTLQETIPRLLHGTGIDPTAVVGVGIDFTSCTMMPVLADGTPLCQLPKYRRRPHAWVKLWKHHAAQPQADRINELARQRKEPWLPRYGGKISSEWFFPKALQILEEDPDVYRAADRLIEAADWIVWQLTGRETRNSCTAGYKAIWSKRDGFPPADFFAALDSRFADVVEAKMSREILPVGSRAGELSERAARWTGLRPGIPVAVGNVDAHVSVPAATVTEPGTMVAIMGTSICHMVLGREMVAVEGMCGAVEDGIVPGFIGFEAGQSAVGDIFAWFVDAAVPPEYHERARAEGRDLHAVLAAEAAELRPGESGLLALDWWNGNRSVLVDADLSGLLLGMTLATRAPELYRALIEATAFGTRVIVEAFRNAGVAVDRIIACGGLPERNPLLMQIFADVTGLEFRVAASGQTSALGAAMFGAVAAGAAGGGYDSIFDAAARMAHLRDLVYRPNPAATKVYDELYRDYVALHDWFGRGGNDVMRRLKALRARVRSGAAAAAGVRGGS
jgi:L-ribulokinase